MAEVDRGKGIQLTFLVIHHKSNSNVLVFAYFQGFPWLYSHHNLMMVAGADLLCEYVARAEGHPDCAIVEVTLGDKLLDGCEPDIVMTQFQ